MANLLVWIDENTALVLLAIVSLCLVSLLVALLFTRQKNNVLLAEVSQLLIEKQQSDLQQFNQQFSQLNLQLQKELASHNEKQLVTANENIRRLQQQQHQFQQSLSEKHHQTLEQLMTVLNKTSKENREEQARALKLASEQIAEKVKELTGTTDERLKAISEQVDKRLTDGFDKTNKTFNDIVKRLALIDEAQKKITELSTNVVSLQHILADKRSRGAFGEVQLNALIRNVLPEQHFSLQHTLSNGKVADCVLWLPEPTGNVVIDAKFPLESYRVMTNVELSDIERKQGERQFKQDIKKHVQDISSKYLIDKETADGAIMFIPAEAVFAEIHGHFPDLVEFANQQRVWLCSPTTLMAILTTARAVLKDEATKEQVHLIQQHLRELSSDFGRFKTRFTNLAKHIDQAATDVKQINTSADKITKRFEKIEQVELQADNSQAIDHLINES